MKTENKDFQILICDDDISDARIVASEAESIIKDSVIRVCLSGAELFDQVRDYDIVLLDIEMPELDGLTVARKIRRKAKGVVIIFVTAIRDYVFDAFKVDAFRYLIKPIERKELTEVLFAAIERRNDNVKNALPAVRSGEPVAQRGHLLVTSGGQHIAVALSDIIYAEIYNRIIILHMVNGDNIEYYGRISDLEKLVGNDFYRCHRSYLINYRFIRRYDSESITMQCGKVTIAKSKYPDFVKGYMAYLKK